MLLNIKTIDRDLYVIQIVHKTESYEYMICTDNMEKNHSLYDVIKVSDYSMICSIMPLLNEQKRNKKFTDLIDCFSQNNAFYAVFSHTDSVMLDEALKTFAHTSYEKLDMLKNLTEKIVMMNIPVQIQTDIILSESIAVSQSMKISFIYDLSHISQYNDIDFGKFQRAMCVLVKKILKKEFESGISSKLTAYCENLNNGIYHEYIEIYADYIGVYEDIKGSIGDEILRKQSRWLKIWEKIKGFLSFVKPFAVCLLILLALIYLFYSVAGNKEDRSQYNTYKSIGSLIIDEYDEQKGK